MNISEHSDQPSIATGYGKSTRVGVVAFALVLIVGLCAAFYFGIRTRHKKQDNLKEEVQRAAEAPIDVDVVHVKAASSSSNLSLPGNAHGFHEATIYARTSGYVSKFFVDIGDHVKENQELAKIETPELDDQLAAAQAKLNALNSEVNVAQTEVKFAQLSFDRWKKLTPGGAVAKQDTDQKEAELQSAKAKLEAAKAQAVLGEKEVDRLTKLASFEEVRAPFNGVISHRYLDVGHDIKPEGSNSTPLYDIAQSDKIRVYVDVPEVEASSIRPGMTVTAVSRDLPDQTFVGKVDGTASAINNLNKTLLVQVIIENKDGAILPGMYMDVDFQATRKHRPLQVPAGAICFRPSGPQVAVISPIGKVHMCDVKITRDLGESVEIVGEGVNVNSTVALNIGSDVETGDRVEAHDVDKPSIVEQPATQPTRTAEAAASLPK